MQFQVPQFETENKLVGPFTVIQFVYVGVAVALSFMLFTVLTTWFWFIVSSFLVGTSLVLALMKVNGRPMPIFMLAAFKYMWEPKVLTIKPKQSEVVGLKNLEPLPPSKKFEIPRQMPAAGPVSAAAGLAMPPAGVAKTAEIPVSAPTGPVSAPAAPSMPAPSAPATPMRISPIGISAMPPATPPAGGLAKQFEISAPAEAAPITPAASAVTEVPVPPPIAPTELVSAPAGAVPAPVKRSRLQSLFGKITTTSSPIPFREESLKQTSKQEGYEFVERATGETIAARRVDYR
jgi:hypothetical protein